MLSKLILIMECSRVFSLPMTLFSWLVIFVYSLINSGNILYGLIALIGIIFAHLGTNIIDDYFDYRYLIKQVGFDKTEYLKHSQKTKCRYLINGFMKESQLISLGIVYFLIAFIVGVYLYYKCGIGVFYFTLLGGIIAILYPFLSRICLSELAVALAYGPALFGGVYYVMTGQYSLEIFIFSIPTMLMTVVLLYIHTIMDYKFDIEEGKITLANRFTNPIKSLSVLKYFLVLAYFSLLLLLIFDILDWQVFIVCLTIPLAIDLYKSMQAYLLDSNNIPSKKWYHFPIENAENFKKRGEFGFMFRLLQSRNLMIYFSLLLIISMIFSLVL